MSFQPRTFARPTSPITTRQRRLDAMRTLPGEVERQGVVNAVGALLLGRRPAGTLAEQWDATAQRITEDLRDARNITGSQVHFRDDFDHGSFQLRADTVKAMGEYAASLSRTDIPERVQTYCDEVTVGHWAFNAPVVNAVEIGDSGIGW